MPLPEGAVVNDTPPLAVTCPPIVMLPVLLVLVRFREFDAKLIAVAEVDMLLPAVTDSDPIVPK